MNSVQDAFKHNRARKNVIVAGGLILVCITLLSCVSSFMIYREGFGDTPWFVQQSLSLFADRGRRRIYLVDLWLYAGPFLVQGSG